MPLAYFLTFSTYGTWLHGTAKGDGSVDRRHNIYGMPFVAPNERREGDAASRMTDPPYVLEETARTIVRDAIAGYCQEKNWKLLALHVRTNHVHLVVSADREPGRLMSDLKARASRELRRSGTDANDKRWTRHGSTRHLFDEASVAAAVAYTLDEQGVSMAIYDPRPHERAAHEVSLPQESENHEVSDSQGRDSLGGMSTNPLTSCAAPSCVALHGGRDISGRKTHEE